MLGDDTLLRLDGGQLLLDAERCWSDVRAFLESDWSPAPLAGNAAALQAQAERLLALVRAPLLEGLEAPWALAARERLRRRFALTLAPIAQALEACDAAAACALYERALAADPLAESLARRLVALQLERGERAEALRAWLHCKAMLALYGTAPAAETVALARRAGLPV
jgi:DNA-binding SARP family transcriptional activator